MSSAMFETLLWLSPLPVVIIILVIWLIKSIGARRGWWQRKEITSEPKLRCPICEKLVDELFPMPRITDRPRERTWPWFKISKHWEIVPNDDMKACKTCKTAAWNDCMVKREEIHVQIARDRENLMRRLYEWETILYSPIRLRTEKKE